MFPTSKKKKTHKALHKQKYLASVEPGNLQNTLTYIILLDRPAASQVDIGEKWCSDENTEPLTMEEVFHFT